LYWYASGFGRVYEGFLMGLRGPAPKPSALEAAEGFPGKRARVRNEPRFIEGEPPKPSGLSAAARRVWRETVEIMASVEGLLTVADGAVLADFCEVRVNKRSIESAMRIQLRKALVSAKAMGRPITRAEAEAALLVKFGRELNTLRHRENVLRRELGLSPSARSSIRLGDPSREPVAGPSLAEILGRPRGQKDATQVN
jgi:phage terminase small subunit